MRRINQFYTYYLPEKQPHKKPRTLYVYLMKDGNPAEHPCYIDVRDYQVDIRDNGGLLIFKPADGNGHKVLPVAAVYDELDQDGVDCLNDAKITRKVKLKKGNKNEKE